MNAHYLDDLTVHPFHCPSPPSGDTLTSRDLHSIVYFRLKELLPADQLILRSSTSSALASNSPASHPPPWLYPVRKPKYTIHHGQTPSLLHVDLFRLPQWSMESQDYASLPFLWTPAQSDIRQARANLRLNIIFVVLIYAGTDTWADEWATGPETNHRALYLLEDKVSGERKPEAHDCL